MGSATRRPIRSLLALAVPLTFALLVWAPAQPSTAAGDTSQQTLQRYAEGTWASFVAMVDDASGLPTDQLHRDGSREVQTSTTNIGAYMWSTLVAERLGLIGHQAVVERLARTISTLEHMERHAP